MNNLQVFLDTFIQRVKSPAVFKKQIIEIIQKITKIELTREELECKEFILYIIASPSVRNEIFIRKKLVLQELGILLGEKSPKDIR